MNCYNLSIFIICIGTLRASEQQIISPRSSPVQNSTISDLPKDDSLNSSKNISKKAADLFSNTIQTRSVLEGIPVILATRTVSSMPFYQDSLVGSDISEIEKECSDIELRLFEFRKELKELRMIQQKKFNDLMQDVRKIKGSFSNRPFNDDIGQELIGMLVIIAQENPQLSFNIGLSQNDQFESFDSKKHSSLMRDISDIVNSNQQQATRNSKPFMLSSEFCDETLADTTILTKAVAVAAKKIFNDDNEDDDSLIIVAPVSQKHKVDRIGQNLENNQKIDYSNFEKKHHKDYESL